MEHFPWELLALCTYGELCYILPFFLILNVILLKKLTSLFCSILYYYLQGIRSGILQCITEAAAMPLSQLCHMCEKEALMQSRRSEFLLYCFFSELL